MLHGIRQSIALLLNSAGQRRLFLTTVAIAAVGTVIAVSSTDAQTLRFQITNQNDCEFKVWPGCSATMPDGTCIVTSGTCEGGTAYLSGKVMSHESGQCTPDLALDRIHDPEYPDIKCWTIEYWSGAGCTGDIVCSLIGRIQPHCEYSSPHN